MVKYAGAQSEELPWFWQDPPLIEKFPFVARFVITVRGKPGGPPAKRDEVSQVTNMPTTAGENMRIGLQRT